MNFLTEDQLRNLTTHRLLALFKTVRVSYYWLEMNANASPNTLREENSYFIRVETYHKLIKSLLNEREHVEREIQEPLSTKERTAQYWKWMNKNRPYAQEGHKVGPIKKPEEVVGRQVQKRSGKPFKSRNKYATVKGITVNPHTNRKAFTFEEDTSIVDCWTCKLREE